MEMLCIQEVRNSVVCKTNFKKSVTVTDLSMTRFMMSMDDALDLVLFAFNKGKMERFSSRNLLVLLLKQLLKH